MEFVDWLEFAISSFNTFLKLDLGFCFVWELVVFSVTMLCCFMLLNGSTKS